MLSELQKKNLNKEAKRERGKGELRIESGQLSFATEELSFTELRSVSIRGVSNPMYSLPHFSHIT